MGESSVSRYSIVERLTEKKLKILDEQAELDNKAEKKKLEVLTLTQNLTDEVEELKSQIKDKQSYYAERIRHVEQEVELIEKSKDKVLKAMEEKIKQIDSALKAVEDISRSAAAQENN